MLRGFREEIRGLRITLGRRHRVLVRDHLAACERMADGWADGDDQRKIMLWRNLHSSAEAIRADLGR